MGWEMGGMDDAVGRNQNTFSRFLDFAVFCGI